MQLRQFFNLTFSHLWSYQTLQDENSLQIALKRYLIPNHLSVYIWIETKLLLCELALFLFHFQMIQRNWARIYMIVLQKIRVIKIMPSLKVIITYLAHYISMYVAWKNDWQSEFDDICWLNWKMWLNLERTLTHSLKRNLSELEITTFNLCLSICRMFKILPKHDSDLGLSFSNVHY